MAKGGRKSRALQKLEEYATSLGPQRGFFSTLTELIQSAPFEKAPAGQWKGYLQPGRKLKREGVEFPLKKEELDYTGLSSFFEGLDERNLNSPVHKAGLLRMLERERPVFGQDLRVPERVFKELHEIERLREERGSDPFGGRTNRLYVNQSRYDPKYYERLSHQSPDSGYEESVTRYFPLLGDPGKRFSSHFTADTLSWSRASSHNLPQGGKMRLVEEIQSDLHQAAADRVPDSWRNYLNEDELNELADLNEDELNELRNIGMRRIPRFGYRTPEQEAILRGEKTAPSAIERRARQTPPDAPFKSPADYAQLELRKQLLNAANNEEDYLALTRSDDQLERYGVSESEGMKYFYDQVYPSVMKKLAKQYGAEMVEVEAPVGTATDARPRVMRNFGFETPEELRAALTDLPPLYFETETGPVTIFEHLMSEVNPHWFEGLDNPQTRSRWDSLQSIKRDLQAGREEVLQSTDWANLVDELIHEIELYLENKQQGRQQNKTFPAIRLTPEVRERIKKAGVPVWTVAGAAVLGEDEEPIGMAKGGHLKAQLERTRQKIESGELFPTLPDRYRASPEAWQKEREELERLRQEVDEMWAANRRRREERKAKRLKKAKGGRVRSPSSQKLEAIADELQVKADTLESEMPKIPSKGIARLRAIANQLQTEKRWGDMQTEARSILDEPGEFAKGGRAKRYKARLRRNLRGIGNELMNHPVELGLAGALATDAAYLTHRNRQNRKKWEEYERQAIEEGWVPSGEEAFAKGGEVKKNSQTSTMSGINMLRAVADTIGTGLGYLSEGFGRSAMREDLLDPEILSGMQEAQPEIREQFRKDARRVAGAFGRQFYGVDPDTGQTRFMFGGEDDQILRPAVLDEMVALPATFIGEMFGANPENWPKSQAALDRLAQIEDDVYERMGIEAPSGFKENLLEAGGIMLGQIPVPTTAVNALKSPLRGVGKFLRERLGRAGLPAQGAALAPNAAMEFLSPIIEPSAKNYAIGTLGGAGIGMGVEEYGNRKMDALQAEIDNLSSQVQSGELSPEEAQRILDRLLSEARIIEPGTGYAKGGRVSNRRFRARFSDREGFELEGRGNSQEEALEKIRQEFARLGEDADGLIEEFGVTVEEIPPIGTGYIFPAFAREEGYEPTVREKFDTLVDNMVQHLTMQGMSLEEADALINQLEPARSHNIGFDDADLHILEFAGPDEVIQQLYDSGVLENKLEALREIFAVPEHDWLEIQKSFTKEGGHAKGGRVKPPDTLKLREHLSELWSEAGVEGTGREMVPVEPPAGGGDVALPSIEEIEQIARRLQPPDEEPSMSRREFLEGAASTMLPLPDPLQLAGQLEVPTVAKAAEAAAPVAKAVTLTPAAIAQKLQSAWDSIFESSEDPDFGQALAELETIPESQRGWIGEVIEDLRAHESDYFDEDLVEEMPNLREQILNTIREDIEKSSREHGILKIDPDATDEITRFIPAEPYERSIEDIIQGYVDPDKAVEILGNPELFDEFSKLMSEYLEVVKGGPEAWESLPPAKQAQHERLERLLVDRFGFDWETMASDIG